MSFEALQRALARVCLDVDVSSEDLAALGDHAPRWRLYRAMIRARFVDTLAEGMPRALSAFGRDALARAVDAWLANAPPTTRYVRELSIQFARFVEATPETLSGAAPWALDAVRYDAAVMACQIALDPSLDGVCDLDMERPVALTPAQRFLRLSHAVHLDGEPAPKPSALVVYRARNDAIETLELTALAADIYEAMSDPTRALTECVRSSLARNDSAAGQLFIETFAEFLGDLLDRGVILGSRAR